MGGMKNLLIKRLMRRQAASRLKPWEEEYSSDTYGPADPDADPYTVAFDTVVTCRHCGEVFETSGSGVGYEASLLDLEEVRLVMRECSHCEGDLEEDPEERIIP